MPKNEYQTFKEFLRKIRNGENVVMDGGDYIVISKAYYRETERKLMEKRLIHSAIYSRT